MIFFFLFLALYLAENVKRGINCLSKVLVFYLQQSKKVAELSVSQTEWLCRGKSLAIDFE